MRVIVNIEKFFKKTKARVQEKIKMTTTKEIEFYLKNYAGLDIAVSEPSRRLKKYRNCKIVSIALEDKIINNRTLFDKLIKLFGFSQIQTTGLYNINIYLTEEKENSINEFYKKNSNLTTN